MERYHFDFSEMESNKEFMKTLVDQVNMGIRETRLSSINDNLGIADGVKMVKERLINTLARRLHHDFVE